MKNPITRLKAILGELLHYGRAAADGTADLQIQFGRLVSALAPLQGRLAELEGKQAHLAQLACTLTVVQERLDELGCVVAKATSEEVQVARLAAALAPLHARLERLEGEVVKADGEILRLQDVVANVNHAFGTKPWPDLFDPFATDEIARRAFRLGNLLTPATADGHRKVRIGHRYDGGYVMIDDWNGIVGAISIGVGDNDLGSRAAGAGHSGCPIRSHDRCRADRRAGNSSGIATA